MICYFDTSAFVPLLIPEPSSPACRRLWDDADDVITSELLYVEAAAALAMGVRSQRLTSDRAAEAIRAMDRFWSDFYVVEPDDRTVSRAAALTFQQSLRAYDAVHCATAEQVNDRDMIFASGDRQQLMAGEALGFCVADVNDADYL